MTKKNRIAKGQKANGMGNYYMNLGRNRTAEYSKRTIIFHNLKMKIKKVQLINSLAYEGEFLYLLVKLCPNSCIVTFTKLDKTRTQTA